MESLTHNYLASDPELEKSTLDSNVENGTEHIFFVCFITNQSHAISCSWKRIGNISRNISTELKKVQDQRMQRWSSLFRKRRLKDQVICKKTYLAKAYKESISPDTIFSKLLQWWLQELFVQGECSSDIQEYIATVEGNIFHLYRNTSSRIRNTNI